MARMLRVCMYLSSIKYEMNNKAVNFLTLFLASSTLICCALPALFVLIGAGATLASLVTALPFLPMLSKYKIYITLGALVSIIIAGYLNYRTSLLPCPADLELGKACMRARDRSRRLYFLSLAIFLFATALTYVIPRFI